MSTILGIARRAGKRKPMQTLQQAEVSTTTGVAMDTRGRAGPRQVTVLSANAWRDVCDELGIELDWTTRRANLLLDGIDLRDSDGLILALGETALLQVTGELEPCRRMEEAQAGLGSALTPKWRGGVTCTVLKSGHVSVGDPVQVRIR